ncbi:NUDIX domain-containing protein [Patescibacteria group bacterium AH-259-L07]|nr:NUDIX domain-containing protein [Patescibacteria group bacterium AH-259-L07]
MQYTFCPKCAGKFQEIKDNASHLQCIQCNFVFYQDSKPTASVILENDKGEVLLTRRAGEPFKGYWDLPGGFCELDEHPELTAKREMKEELGVDIELTGFIGIYTDHYPDQGDVEYTLNIIYTGKIIQGELRPDDDVDACQWFSLNQLPANIAFKNGQQALQELKKQN